MKTVTNQLSFLEITASEKNGTPKTKDNGNGEQPETYKGIYAMHKYWSKKPHNLVANYITQYSNGGEVVLDPFCGSGVTIIESVRLDRRAVGIDINPIAAFSTIMGLKHIDIKALKKNFETLQHEIEAEIDKLYYTECPKCGYSNALATHTIWENSKPQELWVECSACNTSKSVKAPSTKDIEVANLQTG
jgi:ribosomal protein L11 methylase PrmA